MYRFITVFTGYYKIDIKEQMATTTGQQERKNTSGPQAI